MTENVIECKGENIKRALLFLCIVMCVMSGLALFGCADNKKYVVYTVEDLYAMESDKRYILAEDLDLGGNEWYPISVIGFDGAGHTISNTFIRDGGFFEAVGQIKDVTFDRLDVFAEKSSDSLAPYYIGLVTNNKQSRFENVVVNNSKMSFIAQNGYLNIGCIAGSCSEISDCRITDCKIDVIVAGASIKIGGIVGVNYCAIEGCVVDNLNIVCESRSSLNIGGISGENGKTIENCVVRDSNIQVKDGGTTVSVGGIAACSSTERNEEKNLYDCASIGNTINVTSDGSINVGGAVAVNNVNGKIDNCLVEDIDITGISRGKASACKLYIGGLCGASHGNARKSLAVGVGIYAEAARRSDETFTAGLIASTGGSIVNCAAGDNMNVEQYCAADEIGNVVQYGESDWFANSSEYIFDSCIMCMPSCFRDRHPNRNALPAVKLANIIETLKLDANLWEYTDNRITLKITGE